MEYGKVSSHEKFVLAHIPHPANQMAQQFTSGLRADCFLSWPRQVKYKREKDDNEIISNKLTL